MEKLFDSNLLIYALIEDHLASSVCEAFIGKGKSVIENCTTMLTPLKFFTFFGEFMGY